MLKVLIVIILLVWSIGYFLFWGEVYGIVLLGLIIIALLLVFIGFITGGKYL